MKIEKKVLFSATVDSHILQFHLPYLKWFKDQGYEVHVATNGTQNIPYCDVKHVVPFERKPIKVNNLKAIRVLKKIIKKERFTIIHCHTPMGGVVTRLAAKKERKKGTRVIYTAHGFHFYKGAPILNWLIYYPIEKYLAKYTDTLITINEEDYNLAKEKFKNRCKNIEYVPGVGIDTHRFMIQLNENKKNDLKKSIGLNPEDIVLTCIARLNKNKNQGFLIDIMENLVINNKNIHLLLIGKDELKGYYQRKVQKKHLDNNIHFLGNRDDIPNLLAISDLVLSSSKREGLPVNIMEAMYVGLPIVATNCRGNRDLVPKCIKINDKNAFIKAIKDIIEKNITKVEYNVQDFLLENVLDKITFLYKSSFKKNIIMLRSTGIFNDSRITKEIDALSNDNNLIILGWDREGKYQKHIKGNSFSIYFFKMKAQYGQKTKNLFKIFCFEMFIFRKLIRLRNNYQYIYACDLDTGIVSRIIAKILCKKMIYDIYDYYVDSHKITGFFRKIIERQEIESINYACTTIICTEDRKEQIKKAQPKNLVIIHNTPYLPMDGFNDKKPIISSKSDRVKIVYVGILQTDRLLCEVAEYIQNNQQYELHIGGFGKYKDFFVNMAKQNENIFFYGDMNYVDVLKLESECDILFATYDPKIKNHRYSAPNKFYEAISLR